MFIAQRIIDKSLNGFFNNLYTKARNQGKNPNKKRYNTLAAAFRRLASVGIWLVAAVVVLSHFNVNLAVILTGAGAAGIIFGIAGKDIIMDLYVGLMALIEDQYRVGDYIWINQDHFGTVEEITLRTVVLRDIDGGIHIVPHSQASAIINRTYDYSMVNIELGVGYDSDIEKVEAVINDVGQKLATEDEWSKKIIDPIEYATFLRFDESQVTVRASGKVKPGKQWEVASEFRMRVKKAFDENDIEIPFPQRVIRNIEDKPAKTTKK
jgi:small conductance mechanosensitive channel